jgi:hypothetical protein
MKIYKGENQLTDFVLPVNVGDLESAELTLLVDGSKFKTYTLDDAELREGDSLNVLRFELTIADSNNLPKGVVTARLKLTAPNAVFLVDEKEINVEVAQLFVVQ